MIGTIVLLVFLSLSTLLCIHTVSEGHVGVYWRGGALLSDVTEPGFHLKLPFLTSIAEIQVTVQTDSVTQIPCGTSGGVLIHFATVEVVNRLAKDMVYVAPASRACRVVAGDTCSVAVLCGQPCVARAPAFFHAFAPRGDGNRHDTIKNYTINYDKTWIFDKIHHEINQFCSSHTLQEVCVLHVPCAACLALAPRSSRKWWRA